MKTEDQTYFVIGNSDGDTKIDTLTKAELEKRLNTDYYGAGCITPEDLKTEKDTNYWGGKVLIIKGLVVEPKKVEVVTKFEV